ncbi:MAG: hypothetical protein JXB47_04825 [Anaerolineae bacterium]|nr:hypothetical protein [Anaerolineae bacterium]
MISRQTLVRYLPALGFALALLACYLPWIAHPAAALAPNAFDLAEWAGLHPAERYGAPPLVTPGLLRLAVAFCGAGLAFSVPWGWAPGLWVAATLLPPLDFFRNAGEDPNFRQMFVIAVGAAVGVLASRLPRRVQDWPVIATAALGGLAAMTGLVRAKTLVDDMYGAGVGIGGPLALLGFLLAIGGALLWEGARQSPESTEVATGDGSGVGVGRQTAGRDISPTG